MLICHEDQHHTKTSKFANTEAFDFLIEENNELMTLFEKTAQVLESVKRPSLSLGLFFESIRFVFYFLFELLFLLFKKLSDQQKSNNLLIK